MLTKGQAQKVFRVFKKAYYQQGGAGGNKREVVWTYWMRGGLGYWLVDYKIGKAYTARWWQTSRFKKTNDNCHFIRVS